MQEVEGEKTDPHGTKQIYNKLITNKRNKNAMEKDTFPSTRHRFSATNQPKKNGRKKKIYNILKKKGYGKDDIIAAFKELMFYKEVKLEELRDDESKPILVRIVAANIIDSFEDSDISSLKFILDHVLGTPKQTIESDVTTNGKDLAVQEAIKKIVEIEFVDSNED